MKKFLHSSNFEEDRKYKGAKQQSEFKINNSVVEVSVHSDNNCIKSSFLFRIDSDKKILKISGVCKNDCMFVRNRSVKVYRRVNEESRRLAMIGHS